MNIFTAIMGVVSVLRADELVCCTVLMEFHLFSRHQTGWTSLAVNCLFKIARYRGTRAELCSQSFLNRNYDRFDPAQWEIAERQKDPYLGA